MKVGQHVSLLFFFFFVHYNNPKQALILNEGGKQKGKA